MSKLSTGAAASPSVLLVTRKWPPAIGGMETYSVKLAEGLRERCAVETIALPGRQTGREPGLVSLLTFGMTTSLRLLKARPVDVVHVTDLASWPFAWIASARHPHSRICLSAHGSDSNLAYRGGTKGTLYRAYLRLGAALLARASVIANSKYIAEQVRGVGFGSVHVVPLGTDISEPGQGERSNLLYAGRISRPKGLRFLVDELLPKLAPDTRLRVAGTVWDESERPLLSHPRVDYLGPLPQPALAREMASCASVLIPTRESEGFGLVAIEAAACGAWVIASNHSGLAEVVTGPVGDAVDPRDADAWADAVKRALARKRADASSVSAAAQAHVDTFYRWPRVVADTLAIYEQGAPKRR